MPRRPKTDQPSLILSLHSENDEPKPVIPKEVQLALDKVAQSPGDLEAFAQLSLALNAHVAKLKEERAAMKYKDAYRDALALAQGVGMASLAELEYRATGKVIPLDAAGTKEARVPPKYGNPSTGELWTGRGIAPRWMQDFVAAGHDKSEFLLAGAVPGRAPRRKKVKPG